jgi:hypothetical protein
MVEKPKESVAKASAQPKVSVAKPAIAKTAAAKPVAQVSKPSVAKKTAAPSKKAEKTVKATAPKLAVPKSTKPAKQAKVKMVSDSFSMPAPDFAALSELKKKCLRIGLKVKKSELLRAGLSLLAKLPPADLAKVIQTIQQP